MIRAFCAVLGALSLVLLSRVTWAAAPCATVTGVVLQVSYQQPPAKGWSTAKVGTKLYAGARVRTAKRSKCEIAFPDKSRIRMNELSELAIANATSKDVKLARGNLYARIVAGTGARIAGAGGVASIKGTQLTYDGQTLAVYEGAADHELARGVDHVPAGNASSTWRPDIYEVPALQWEGGKLRPWFQEVSPGVSLGTIGGSRPGSSLKYQRAGMITGIARMLTGGIVPWGDVGVIVEQAPPGGKVNPRGSYRGSGAALGALGASFLLEDWNKDPHPLGSGAFGPFFDGSAFAIEGENRNDMTGGELRACAMKDNLFLGLGWVGYSDYPADPYIALSEAFLAYRDEGIGDIVVGKQWFLEGPVNNTRLGSLMSFDRATALRWQGRAGKAELDLAYLYDMLPTSSERREGWAGRAQFGLWNGTVGLNALYDNDLSDTGVSCDFCFPVLPGTLDLYGELGDDAAGNHLQTWGAYFPGLYQSLGVDLYLEYAKRGSLNSLTSASVYKEIGDGWSGLLLFKDVEGKSAVFGLGIAREFGHNK